ncbi:MFS transporter [Pseudomonas sp. Bc-h]|uniref:MFS transporter n=1 Tax=Pseudomonas sp. Bc-h TaxID=1943632 RepID=UPI0009DAEA98|nr:MFS transporter [Pseudomonas sp. Bc-h]OQR28364.1 MFS transporter [Pseudomonas sp. Bc-h]
MNDVESTSITDLSTPALEKPIETSGLGQWMSVFAVALGAFAFVTTEYLPVGILPQIASELGVTDGTAGLMVTIPGIVAAISAPTVMIGAGKVNRRHLLILLAVLLVASNLISAVAPNLLTMLLGRGLLGVALGGFWAIAIAAAGRLVTRDKAAKATAIIFAGITFATVLGVPFGTFISTLFSWRASFLATAALALIALAAQMMTLPSLAANESLQVKTLLRYLGKNSTQRSILLMGLIIAAHFASYTYIAPFLVQRAGFSASGITLTLLGFGVLGMLANFLVSASVTRHLQLSLAGAVLLMIASLVSLPWVVDSGAGVIAAVLVWGVAYGAIPLALSTWMQLTSPQLPEASSAMLVTTFQIAIASGSLLGGMIVDGYGIEPTLFFGAVLGGLGLVAMATFGLGHDRLINKLQG